MKRRLSSMTARLSGQRGFTLVELLVGMVAAMVVSSGLFTILDVTLHQTTRTQSRVDATQRARNALETIGNEMHSACVEHRVIPIHLGSTASSVIFLSQYGNGVALTPLFHKLTFSSIGNTLTDTTYQATGDAPNWTYDSSSPLVSRTLLTNVDQSGITPVFQYYSSSNSGQTAVVPNGTGSTLTETQSETVTEVRMTLVVRPGGGSNEDASLTPDTVTNSVVLRLTPLPNPGTPGQDFFPCE
jgi:Tfp pilus assembly protein PilW